MDPRLPIAPTPALQPQSPLHEPPLQDQQPHLFRRRLEKVVAATEKISRSEVGVRLKRVDFFSKTDTSLEEQRASGGFGTVVTLLIVFWLFLSETSSYFSPNIHDELVVDTTFGGHMRLKFNMTFPGLACSQLSLDVVDATGEQHNAVDHDIFKKSLVSHIVQKDRINTASERGSESSGSGSRAPECGSCYGAAPEDQCCQTCDDVRAVYRKRGWSLPPMQILEQCKNEQEARQDGCMVWGSLHLHKVSGNVHFAPGKSFEHVSGGVARHVHNFDFGEASRFNASHIIHELSFSDEEIAGEGAFEQQQQQQRLGDLLSPLQGVSKHLELQSGSYKYFLKVVPSVTYRSNRLVSRSFTYSVTEHDQIFDLQRRQMLPGVYFIFDLSPLRLEYTVSYMPFLHYFTRLCAIIGGVMIVSGWLIRTWEKFWDSRHGLRLKEWAAVQLQARMPPS